MNEEQVVSVLLRRGDGATVGISLPWVRGKTVREYLRHPLLRAHHPVNLATRMRMVDQNRSKLRLRSVPQPGGYIYFVNPMTGVL